MHNGAALEASLASRTLPAEVTLELSLPGVKEMEMSPCCKTQEKIFRRLKLFAFMVANAEFVGLLAVFSSQWPRAEL